MKKLKEILQVILLLSICCVNGQYLEDYEPINDFLETQKIDKNKKIILQSDKVKNIQTLRLFNGGEGIEHIIDPIDKIDYTGGLFEKKHWEKMYKTYINDTISKYWKKEDFPQYNFILEKGTGLVFKQDFILKYINSGINEILVISEPIYYMNKKYVLFCFEKASFEGGGNPQVVIMTKEKDKWVVVRMIGDYWYY